MSDKKKWRLWPFRKKDQGDTTKLGDIRTPQADSALPPLSNQQAEKKSKKFKRLKLRHKQQPQQPVFSVEQALQPQLKRESRPKTLRPGSEGEHCLQEKFDTKGRAHTFYNRQVLDYLAPKMQEFIGRQEFLFIATADGKGECDCTSKFGKPGFIRVLSEKHLMYPEYRGNGVMANMGNLSENPHMAMLMIDFCEHTIGIHVNGKARVVENDELLQFADKLPKNVVEEIRQEGKKQPERWVMVEVEEAYIQCSKHIPLMQKLDKNINWGTDDDIAKGGDFFQLADISLYDRVGGSKAMDIVVDHFYQKVLEDGLVAPFFKDVDMKAQRQKQKSFLTMAFGGPHDYGPHDLRAVHKPLVEKMGLTDAHFDRVMDLLKETFQEVEVHEKEIKRMLDILETMRDDVLNR